MKSFSGKGLRWEWRDGVIELTLDREPANEIGLAMLAELEQEQILREEIAGLSDRCRQMVHLLFYEIPPRPYEVIADELGMATGSVGAIRSRCLEALRKSLEKRGFR